MSESDQIKTEIYRALERAHVLEEVMAYMRLQVRLLVKKDALRRTSGPFRLDRPPLGEEDRDSLSFVVKWLRDKGMTATLEILELESHENLSALPELSERARREVFTPPTNGIGYPLVADEVDAVASAYLPTLGSQPGSREPFGVKDSRSMSPASLAGNSPDRGVAIATEVPRMGLPNLSPAEGLDGAGLSESGMKNSASSMAPAVSMGYHSSEVSSQNPSSAPRTEGTRAAPGLKGERDPSGTRAAVAGVSDAAAAAGAADLAGAANAAGSRVPLNDFDEDFGRDFDQEFDEAEKAAVGEAGAVGESVSEDAARKLLESLNAQDENMRHAAAVDDYAQEGDEFDDLTGADSIEADLQFGEGVVGATVDVTAATSDKGAHGAAPGAAPPVPSAPAAQATAPATFAYPGLGAGQRDAGESRTDGFSLGSDFGDLDVDLDKWDDPAPGPSGRALPPSGKDGKAGKADRADKADKADKAGNAGKAQAGIFGEFDDLDDFGNIDDFGLDDFSIGKHSKGADPARGAVKGKASADALDTDRVDLHDLGLDSDLSIGQAAEIVENQNFDTNMGALDRQRPKNDSVDFDRDSDEAQDGLLGEDDRLAEELERDMEFDF